MKAYQFKISIVDAHPPLWRRCIVPTQLSLEQLGEAIQVMMGWSGSHLSSFRLPASHRMIYMNDEWTGETGDESMLGTLEEDLGSEKWFEYTYDFGDDWRHRIQIEAVLDDYDLDYPQVIKAKGDNPVEDCGGVYELEELAATARAPYNMAAVNAILRGDRFHQSTVSAPKPISRESAQVEEGMPSDLQDILQTPEFKGLPKAYQNKVKGLMEAIMDRMSEEDEPDISDILSDLEDEPDSWAEDSPLQIEEIPHPIQEMLETARKADLVQLARRKGLMIKQTLRKAEFAAELARAMLDPAMLRCYLLWLPAAEMYHLLTELKIADAEWMKPLINENVLDTCAMSAWFGSGYGGRDDIGGMVVPSDVVASLRKILTKGFLQQYHQYWWLSQTFQAADTLYLFIPRDIFQQLLAQWPGFNLTEQEVLTALEMRPAELPRIEIGSEYIVSAPVPQGIEAQCYIRHPGDNYFLPTEQQIWMKDILTQQVKSMLKQANRQFTRDWEGNEDGSILEMLAACLPGLTVDLSERELKQVFQEEFADYPEWGELWKEIRGYLRKMDPYIRKTANHGFTDSEKKAQQQTVRKAKKADQKQKKKSMGKVISLEAHRRKRKNKRK